MMMRAAIFIFLVSCILGEKWGDVGDDCVDPKAKCVIREMDDMIANRVAWDNKTAWIAIMEQFFTEDMIYDTNYNPNEEELNNSTGIEDWFYQEHIPYNLAFDNVTFNQLIFASEEETATTTTYGKGRWKGDIGTIPGSEKFGEVVVMRIYDFYIMREDKIFYNWMILDTVHLMLQVGYRVLPKAPLREGWVQAPRAMDGIPAPISRLVDPLAGPTAKILVEEAILTDLVFGVSPSRLWYDDMTWYGPVGLGLATNKAEYETFFLAPLREAFSDRVVDLDVLTCEGAYCGAHGYLTGTHTGPWLGEEATYRTVSIRFGLHFRVDVENGMIPEGYAMFDLPAAFDMMGVDLYGRMTQEYKI